jgi:hypothetical protein
MVGSIPGTLNGSEVPQLSGVSLAIDSIPGQPIMKMWSAMLEFGGHLCLGEPRSDQVLQQHCTAIPGPATLQRHRCDGPR